jgi:hypothetical protein
MWMKQATFRDLGSEIGLQIKRRLLFLFVWNA